MTKKVYNSYQAVLFDLDGTLANSLDALKKVYFEFLSSHNIVGSDEEFSELNGPSLLEIVQVIRARYGLTPSLAELHRLYITLLENEYAKNVLPFQGAEPLLSWLRQSGITLGLVTSFPRILADRFLSANGWANFFEIISTGDTVAAAKPNPEIYILALSALKIAPDQVVAVEDSISGIQAAVNAGLRVIGVSSDHQDRLLNAGALNTVCDLYAIKELFQMERWV